MGTRAVTSMDFGIALGSETTQGPIPVNSGLLADPIDKFLLVTDDCHIPIRESLNQIQIMCETENWHLRFGFHLAKALGENRIEGARILVSILDNLVECQKAYFGDQLILSALEFMKADRTRLHQAIENYVPDTPQSKAELSNQIDCTQARIRNFLERLND